MEDMAREYIRRRNPNGIYIVTPHFDKEHYHIHFCASGVEYKTGKSLRLSKIDLQKLKKDIQDYQIEKYPELSKSVVAHNKKGKPHLTEKEYQLKLRTGRETNKEHVIAILEACFKKANSKDSLLELLLEHNLKTYERNGKTTGIVFNGQKFRLKRMGFSEERFITPERTGVREKSASEIRRNKQIGVVIQRSR